MRASSFFFFFVVVVVSAIVAGCDKETCTEPDDADLAALPQRLSDTGLFDDDAVIAYAPAFGLWSDGAEKKRAIRLPDGASIDTSDMDDWRFPAGTKLWKEFTRDDVRLETRLLLKTGDDDDQWIAAAYLWNSDETDAELLPEGASDVRDTRHDVPPAAKCQACHGGRKSFVLGFSAVQLANVDADVDANAFTLDDAVARGLLSDPPSSTSALHVPGNATERAALGYLHANCAHCHNQQRPEREGPRCYDPRRDFDLMLAASALGDVDDTAVYRSVVDDDGLVQRGKPDESKLLSRMQQRASNALVNEQMPPLASEDVDDDGVAAITAWIDSL